jgi:hypothetical protein
MDFCTLTDFLDHVLPHMTGSIATVIKEARGRTATLVSTGSSMATALVNANADSVANASDDVRRVVESAREATEANLEAEGQVPVSVMRTATGSKKICSANVIFSYIGCPEGQCVYHRESISNAFPDFLLPTNCKINGGTSKIGRGDHLFNRAAGADYRKDGAYFDTVMTTRTLADSEALESCLKSAISPYRVGHSKEYYHVQAYLDAHHIVPLLKKHRVRATRRHLTMNPSAITVCPLKRHVVPEGQLALPQYPQAVLVCGAWVFQARLGVLQVSRPGRQNR